MAVVSDTPSDLVQTSDVFKVLVIGDSGVGKSCLVTRFTKNSFAPDSFNTIGVDFRLQKIAIDGREVILQIWDSAGYERFRIMTSSFYKGAHGVIMVYDVTNNESLDHLKKWLKEVQLYAPETVKTVVVGNKCDLISEHRVSPYVGQSFLENNPHFEASARTGKNVDEIFFTLSSLIARRKKYSQNWVDKSLIPQFRKEIQTSDSFEIYEMIHKVERTRSRRSTKLSGMSDHRPRNRTISSGISRERLKRTGYCFCCQII